VAIHKSAKAARFQASLSSQDATEELSKFIDEEYHRIKKILDNNSVPAEEDFTLTVGIQNAYLG
jgi:K+/H+ antiporter YhaU regulatory subunit KhtT